MAAPDPAPQLSKDFLAPEGASTHALREARPDRFQGGGETFLKSLQRLRVLGIVAGAGRELAIAERAQFPAQRRLADRDPELLPDPQGRDPSAASEPRHGSPASGRSRRCSAKAWRWLSFSLQVFPGPCRRSSLQGRGR